MQQLVEVQILVFMFSLQKAFILPLSHFQTCQLTALLEVLEKKICFTLLARLIDNQIQIISLGFLELNSRKVLSNYFSSL